MVSICKRENINVTLDSMYHHVIVVANLGGEDIRIDPTNQTAIDKQQDIFKIRKNQFKKFRKKI